MRGLPMLWARLVGGYRTTARSHIRRLPAEAVASAADSAGALATGRTHPNAVSLEAVLELVQHAAGTTIDADAPLMAAGINSRSAIELRSRLQSVAGADGASLPITLIFDFPTQRELEAYCASLVPTASAHPATVMPSAEQLAAMLKKPARSLLILLG